MTLEQAATYPWGGCPWSMTGKWTIADIKIANRDKGFHFFDRSSMRFFDSRVASQPYHGKGGVYFITSEQFHGSGGYTAPRKYTVRRFNPATSDIHTCGRFNEIHSIEDARMVARECARVGMSEVEG